MVKKIPLAIVKQIGKEFNPEMRISKNALIRLQDIGTDFIRVTIGDCKKLADHGNRKTILEKDVILATS